MKKYIGFLVLLAACFLFSSMGFAAEGDVGSSGLSIVAQIPMVLAMIETIKRFIPTQYNKWGNPVLALIIGLLTSFYAGGSEQVIGAIIDGILVGIGAIATYKVPKELGKAIGTEAK